MRCELHTALSQCQHEALITVAAVVGVEPLEHVALWTAHACREHAWEATARAALHAERARFAGHDDARILVTVETAGQQILDLYEHDDELADRWPLAALEIDS